MNTKQENHNLLAPLAERYEANSFILEGKIPELLGEKWVFIPRNYRVSHRADTWILSDHDADCIIGSWSTYERIVNFLVNQMRFTLFDHREV